MRPCPPDMVSEMPPKQPNTSTSVRADITRIAADGTVTQKLDPVAVEEPLELRVEGKPVAVIMRTPGNDEEIAAGFLLTEGMIRSKRDLFEVRRCPSVGGESSNNVIDALLVKASKADLKRLTRHVFTGSSCGICGKATIESVHQQFAAVAENTFSVRVSQIRRMPAAIMKTQSVFRKTGGLHAAALFDSKGRLQISREDVGRHNATDKVLGRALLDESLPLDNHVLFVSGRVSFEIAQKALAAGIAVVAGISAPSSLAIDFAEESGQTLVGFVRNGSMNVYANPERIRTRVRLYRKS